ncbi:hypothetical protein SNEBB_008849 [Seison nebaliae]|nr:hypothetical protein SNEBB_008849 [Seison nebaliae]
MNFKSLNYRMISTIVGGFLIHLTLGTLYCIGNMSPYVVSYLRKYGSMTSAREYTRYSSIIWVSSTAVVGQGLCIFPASFLAKRFGRKLTIVLGCSFVLLGTITSYWSIRHSIYLITVTYGLLFGIGIGLAYTSPIQMAIQWLPEKQGYASGFVLSGFGLGAFVFNQIQTHYINPQNLHPDEPYSVDFPSEKYFSQESLLKRVPTVFLVLAGCYFFLQLVGVLLLRRKTDQHQLLLSSSNDSINNGDEVGEIVDEKTTKYFYLKEVKTFFFIAMFLTMFFNSLSILLVSTMYKAYGQTFIKDDKFLAIVGAIAGIMNSSGRVMWGYICDRFSYKLAMSLICLFMTIFTATFLLTPYGGKFMYFVWTCSFYLTFCGMFSVVPGGIAKYFDADYFLEYYGIIFFAQALVSPITAIISQSIYKSFSWPGIFLTSAVASTISFFANVCQSSPNHFIQHSTRQHHS